MNRLLFRIGLTICLLAVCAVAGHYLGQRFAANAEAGDGPELAVAADLLDFGEAFEQPALRWVLPIENRGRADIRITRFDLSCNCAKVTPPSLVIPARQTEEIALTLDLSARGKLAGSAAWPFQADITPIVERTNERTNERTKLSAPTWVVRGSVRGVLRLEPAEIDFGRRSEDGGPLPAQAVRITALTPLGRLRLPEAGAGFAATVTRVADREFALQLQGQGKPTLGYFERSFTLVPDSPDGRELPGKRIIARGMIVPDCEATPAAVLFGVRPVGTRCEESVTVRSLTGCRIKLKGLKVVGSGLSAEERPAVEGVGLVVRHSVAGTAPLRGLVVLAIERDDGTAKTLEIKVTAQATPAATMPKGGG